MKLTIFLFFSLFISLSISSDSNLWAQQLSMDQIVASVEHDGRRLNVWRENKESRQRFFVTPLSEIIKNSSRCSNDKYSKVSRYVLTFCVRFWDRLIAEIVQMALSSKGFNASIDEILPLPMQMIRLNINPNVKSKVYVDNQWRSNQNQPNTMIFKLYTRSKEFCKTIQKDLEEDTFEFLTETNLIVEFMLVAAKREYRNIKITGSTMAKSSFFSKLENKYSKNGIVYLIAEDMNKLARDVAHTVYASDEVTANYIGSDKEDQLVSKIIDTLKDQKALATEIQKDDWNSVFWNDIFSRPDVQTSHYNQSFTYDQGKKHFIYDEAKDKQFRSSIQDKSHNDSQNSASISVGVKSAVGGSYIGIGASLSENVQVDKSSNDRQVNESLHTNDTQTRDTIAISEDKMKSHLQQQGQTIRWTGAKFEPKALELYRINTRALKAKDEIAYQRVELTMVESTQKIELRPELTTNHEDINELQAVKLELERIRRMVENNSEESVKSIYLHNKLKSLKSNFEQEIRNAFNESYKNLTAEFSNNLWSLKTQMAVEMSSVVEKMNLVENNLQQQIINITSSVAEKMNMIEKNLIAINECELDVSMPGKYFNLTNSCYYLYKKQKTWEDAKQYCISTQSNLTSIHSEEENNFLGQLITSSQIRWIWTGLYFDTIGQRWRWIEDESEATFFNWDESQSSKNDSMLLNESYKWYSLSRNHPNGDSRVYNFVCKRKL